MSDPVELAARFAKRFPGGVVIAADLTIRPDEGLIHVLFGPSGCGKTTILRCLAGLERPERGSIRFGDVTWFDAERGRFVPPQSRGIGYLSQDYALFPHLTVSRNIAYGLRGLSASERRRRVGELLDRLHLWGLEERYPGQLSGGQQQRVALARALARRPRLVLLDEPLSALDAPTRETLRRELRRVLSDLDVPSILVTHDRAEVITLADRVSVLDAGQIKQSGTIDEVFNRPADLSVARIVGVETVVSAKVVQVADDLATVRVGQAALIALVEDAEALGKVEDVYVCIRGEDVVLQPWDAGPSSARNRLAGTIRAIVPEGRLLHVTVDCGFPLSALVTRPARDELDLHEGQRVRTLIKAPAVHLIPRQ